MPIRVDERFVVRAPVAPAWELLVDPHRVVSCVPGGELVRAVDDRTFVGKMAVKVGPLTLAYRGRVHLAAVDAANRRVTIVGYAREDAGTDTARLTLESWLTPFSDTTDATDSTEVIAHARVDVAGRVAELGRSVLEQLGHLVFQEFASSVRARVEAEEARRVALAAGAPAPPLPPPAPPLRAFPLVLKALRAWLSWKLRPRASAVLVSRASTGSARTEAPASSLAEEPGAALAEEPGAAPAEEPASSPAEEPGAAARAAGRR